MRKAITGANSLLGIEDQHPLQKVHRCDIISPKLRKEDAASKRLRTLGVGRLEPVGQWLAFALGERLDESQGLEGKKNCQLLEPPRRPRGRQERAHVFAANGFDNIIRRRAQQFGDDGELVDMVFARE